MTAPAWVGAGCPGEVAALLAGPILGQVAERLGLSREAALGVAVNRLYWSLFAPQEDGEVTESQFLAADGGDADPVVSSVSLLELVNRHLPPVEG